MKLKYALSAFLVFSLMNGCKCSCGDKLASDRESAENAPQPTSQNKLLEGDQTPPNSSQAGEQADGEDEDKEKPALPIVKPKPKEKKDTLPEHCIVSLTSGDSNQFSKNSIKIHKSCPRIRLVLRHTGTSSKEIGGHNFVIFENRNLEDFLEKAIVAGSYNNFVPQHDGRVVAATKLVGAKQTTQFEFSPKNFAGGAEYIFLCTFPDHAHTQKGKIIFE